MQATTHLHSDAKNSIGMDLCAPSQYYEYSMTSFHLVLQHECTYLASLVPPNMLWYPCSEDRSSYTTATTTTPSASSLSIHRTIPDALREVKCTMYDVICQLVM
jgi:hypothetical protein